MGDEEYFFPTNTAGNGANPENLKSFERIGAGITKVILIKKGGVIKICFGEGISPADILHFALSTKISFLSPKKTRIYSNPLSLFGFAQNLDGISIELSRNFFIGKKKIVSFIHINPGDNVEISSNSGTLLASMQITRDTQ